MVRALCRPSSGSGQTLRRPGGPLERLPLPTQSAELSLEEPEKGCGVVCGLERPGSKSRSCHLLAVTSQMRSEPLSAPVSSFLSWGDNEPYLAVLER